MSTEKELSAMQELILELDLMIDEDGEGYLVDIRNGLIEAIKAKTKSLLPKEKAQIVGAYKKGFDDGWQADAFHNEFSDGEDYYNNKYNQ